MKFFIFPLILFSFCVNSAYSNSIETNYLYSEAYASPKDSSKVDEILKMLLFDEFHSSLNRTNVQDENTEDRMGFGLGLNYTLFKPFFVNLILGLEFNRTNQFKDYRRIDHDEWDTDIDYRLNSISIPVTGRLNLGNKTKFIVELGAFVDFPLRSRSSGTKHELYNSNTEDDYVIDEHEWEFEREFKSSFINYGPTAGIGLIVPIWKKDFIFRFDYKLGMNKLVKSEFVNNWLPGFTPEVGMKAENVYNSYFRVSLGMSLFSREL